MNAVLVNPIALTRTLRQEFTRNQLRQAQREIRSFLKFQVSSEEVVRMVRYYLHVTKASA